MNKHFKDKANTAVSRMHRYETDDACWNAVVSKDAAADGHFFYAVKTTGIYCRPTCSSRLPHRENVVFFKTCDAAQSGGFRACERCQPHIGPLADRHVQAVRRACELIERSLEIPDLKMLARNVGVSPYHFHRIFKRIAGLTPKAYAQGYRARQMRKKLINSTTVTEAIYEAGYNSNSRFYAEAESLLGMRPSRFKKGGIGETIRFAIAECAMGAILVAASAKGVCAIFLGDEPDILLRNLQDQFSRATLVGGDSDFEKTVASVIGLVEDPQACVDLPLDVRGTVFQQRVWAALQAIPAGTTATYTDIARELGIPKAVRAVAQACAANKLAVVIPCHRVLRRDGNLAGYRWGVERKRRLLERESGSLAPLMRQEPCA